MGGEASCMLPSIFKVVACLIVLQRSVNPHGKREVPFESSVGLVSNVAFCLVFSSLQTYPSTVIAPSSR